MSTLLQTLFPTSNSTILAIPAWHVFCLAPHLYAAYVASNGKLDKWDNRNPRAAGLKSNLKSTLSPEAYQTYERGEAASANAFENLQLVIGAVIIGNMARLPRDGLTGFDALLSALLGLRAAYTAVYIGNKTQGLAAARSGLYFAQVGVIYTILFKSAKLLF